MKIWKLGQSLENLISFEKVKSVVVIGLFVYVIRKFWRKRKDIKEA